MFCQKYWYKKSYRGTWIEMLFVVMLTTTLVIETNLISHSLSIPNNFMKIFGVAVLAFLAVSVQIRAKRLAADIKRGEREIFSDHSRKYLSLVNKFTVVTLFPLLITIFSEQDNIQLFGIIVSAILIIRFKSYLDCIVTFSLNEYSSGFDDIRLDSNTSVKKIQERTHPTMGNVITFELYFKDKCKGYDKFMETDYLVLKKRVK